MDGPRRGLVRSRRHRCLGIRPRDTGAVFLDMNPDRRMAERMRAILETDGDQLTDLHPWRLSPGHLGAILSIATQRQREPEYYHRS